MLPFLLRMPCGSYSGNKISKSWLAQCLSGFSVEAELEVTMETNDSWSELRTIQKSPRILSWSAAFLFTLYWFALKFKELSKQQQSHHSFSRNQFSPFNSETTPQKHILSSFLFLFGFWANHGTNSLQDMFLLLPHLPALRVVTSYFPCVFCCAFTGQSGDRVAVRSCDPRFGDRSRKLSRPAITSA